MTASAYIIWDYTTNGHTDLYNIYIVCPESNVSDFFAQPRTARKGKWGSRQVEGEPTYTVGPSSVESAPL